MDQIIDFTNCEYGYKDYGGSDSKISIVYNSEHFMLKKPQKLVNPTDLQSSYANNVISEYVGSHIVASLGLETHETMLGFYENELVVACKDFCPPGSRNVEFANFMREIYKPDEIGRFPTYKQLYDVFSSNPRLRNIAEAGISRYWQEFVADALIGNFDRHKGNFGFIVNELQKTITVSPIYDCGSSLYPNLSEKQMVDILSNKEEIELRMYKFPRVALNKNNNPHKEEKFSYMELLSGEFYDRNCINAFSEIYKKIDLQKIHSIIDQTPIISDTRKYFYKKIVGYRKQLILDKAYSMCLENGLISLDPTSVNKIILDKKIKELIDNANVISQFNPHLAAQYSFATEPLIKIMNTDDISIDEAKKIINGYLEQNQNQAIKERLENIVEQIVQGENTQEKTITTHKR